MVVSEQNEFSPRGLRGFYFSLAGLIVVSVVFLLGLVFFQKGNDDLVNQVRALMLNSWWMVLSGVITFSAAYMIVAFLFALGQGVPQPRKPTRRAVVIFALIFGLIHSFRLAYGGYLPFDFIVIFARDLFGILLALAATTFGPVKQIMYRGGRSCQRF